MHVSVCFEIVLILTEDRRTVCTERTIRSEIIFDTRMELLGDLAHLESHFGPFGDAVRVVAR
jgi:hypothetical protein